KYETALEYMERILNLGGDADFDHLAAHAKTLSGEERAELIRLYEALRQRHPNNPEVRYSVALLQQSNGMPTHAMDTLKPLLDEYPDFQPAILLYGALMFERGDKEAALSYVRRNTRRYPDSHRLGTLYARMLVEDRQLQAAEDEFLALTKRFPDQPGLRLSFALVALENNHLDLAEKTLRELIGAGHHVQEAHYYLGRIAEDRDQRDQAIDHYQQIESGPHYLSALSRLSLLMARNGELTAVLDRLHTLRTQQPQQSENFWLIEVNLLNELQERTAAVRSASEALTAYPDNLRLRYTRAMLLDEQTEFDMMEADLRYILEREPDNAVALNALGYTLTLRRERLDEALALITRALTLDPENPAIIDSMGWIAFRQGRLQEATQFLARAWTLDRNPEIAAHLGEVLWVSGKRDDAVRILREGAEIDAENAVLVETLERLGVSL
ncbi:MAG: tetratricopeptide repeat protein, partial [Gammaproteobacteria bacterium]|nr:tetratricopeptide repeat protein [Gammaproteobacteria bacterium]